MGESTGSDASLHSRDQYVHIVVVNQLTCCWMIYPEVICRVLYLQRYIAILMHCPFQDPLDGSLLEAFKLLASQWLEANFTFLQVIAWVVVTHCQYLLIVERSLAELTVRRIVGILGIEIRLLPCPSSIHLLICLSPLSISLFTLPLSSILVNNLPG